MTMSSTQKLSFSLFLLRLGVFIVMLMWTLDKFINPEHAGRVLEKFYSLGGFSDSAFYVMGAAQLCVVMAFGLGILKRYSYGLILAMHFMSTASSYAKYMDPWNSLLFFAAFPMLAACVALYLLRDNDTMFSFSK